MHTHLLLPLCLLWTAGCVPASVAHQDPPDASSAADLGADVVDAAIAEASGPTDAATDGAAEEGLQGDSVEAGVSPSCVAQPDGTTWCDNGLLRVRSSAAGITWFDIFHPSEEVWYVNKNNLNLHVGVPGQGFVNTELGQLQAEVTVLSTTPDAVIAQHRFVFPHGAVVDLELTLQRGIPRATFRARLPTGSAPVDGFLWQVSFGQAESVNELHFDGHDVDVADLPRPFPGESLAAQHVEWFGPLDSQEFTFSGVETALPDPANPPWMSRVLGLQQHITWHSPMRPQDQFAFEARDVPWQSSWSVPEVTPWIEGLWFVRQGSFVDGDQLTYGIDAYHTLGR